MSKAAEPIQRQVMTTVLCDLMDRDVAEKKETGDSLRTHNGRDALWDAYQDALNLVMHLRQEIMGREEDEIDG